MEDTTVILKCKRAEKNQPVPDGEYSVEIIVQSDGGEYSVFEVRDVAESPTRTVRTTRLLVSGNI